MPKQIPGMVVVLISTVRQRWERQAINYGLMNSVKFTDISPGIDGVYVPYA